MATLQDMVEHCEVCNSELEIGQIGKCDFCHEAAPVVCPTHSRFPGDIVGCGSTNVAGPDDEGLFDCADCGLFFKPQDDGVDGQAVRLKKPVEAKDGETFESKAQRLSVRFSKILREWLSEAEMADVLARNATEKNPQICHTHDFVDSNQAMLDAVKELGFREIDLTSPISDAGVDLWNAAWCFAKNNGFRCELSA